MVAKQAVASQASIEQSPESVVLQLSASMESLAAEEDWQGVESIAEELRRAALQVPETERREMLLAVRRSIENVQALAVEARRCVSEKLSGIRRGKNATRAYGDATGT